MESLDTVDLEQQDAEGVWLRRLNEEAIRSGDAIDITPEELGRIVRRGIDRARNEQERKAG